MRLYTLPDDINLDIFKYLDVVDIFRMRMVCKHFYSLTYLRAIWQSAYVNGCKYLPLPPGPSETQTTRDLESILAHSMKFYLNWTSPSPKPIRTRMSRLCLADFTFAKFVNDGRYLLEVGDDSHDVIVCHDLEGEEHRTLFRHELSSTLVNVCETTFHGSRGLLTFSSEPFCPADQYQLRLEFISFESAAEGPPAAVIELAPIESTRYIIEVAVDRSLVVGLLRGGSLIQHDIETGEHKILREETPPESSCTASSLALHYPYLVIIRHNRADLYRIDDLTQTRDGTFLVPSPLATIQHPNAHATMTPLFTPEGKAPSALHLFGVSSTVGVTQWRLDLPPADTPSTPPSSCTFAGSPSARPTTRALRSRRATETSKWTRGAAVASSPPAIQIPLRGWCGHSIGAMGRL
ncbi:hypothetical protein BOTBODRAFT_25892 [Botryobasidium botryosum FD-172 SS1]|uniref:F-box domain-containing protein n=1 Tax=Botryobasidium botryosum (strain FD-172 SS1) TaxID=930990 RepID=A0A067N0S2_BOTB1|nr:hypothetical protein BOTBODRAFT_25892 [Botryobasidium botryosum FD-172 SS1]